MTIAEKGVSLSPSHHPHYHTHQGSIPVRMIWNNLMTWIWLSWLWSRISRNTRVSSTREPLLINLTATSWSAWSLVLSFMRYNSPSAPLPSFLMTVNLSFGNPASEVDKDSPPPEKLEQQPPISRKLNENEFWNWKTRKESIQSNHPASPLGRSAARLLPLLHRRWLRSFKTLKSGDVAFSWKRKEERKNRVG